ncbi:Ig-like domain-containing protein, partial [candidate division CSSED10-310 bacterium]
MRKAILLLLVSISALIYVGCDIDLDAKIDVGSDKSGQAEIINVTVTPLVSGLNYPTSVRIITSEDPMGTGEDSVLKKGNVLVTNAGSAGEYAHSVLQIDPVTGSISLFSQSSFRDLYGEAAVDRPVGLSFPGPYPWVANATWCQGSVSVLDASPGQGYDGPYSQAGEPIDGPNYQGVYGCGDFRLTVVSVTPAPNTTNVSLNATIAVQFSKPINPLTITPATFTVSLEDVDNPTYMDPIEEGVIAGKYYFSTDLRTVSFVPDSPLVSSTDYELTIYEITLAEEILDAYGNKFDADLYTPDDEEDYSSTFSTEIERTPPTIVSIQPEFYEQVSQFDAIVIEFSEPVRYDTFDDHSFKLFKGYSDGYYMAETISGDKYFHRGNKIFAFIPDDSDYAERCRYYMLLRGTLPTGFPGIQDRAGNGLDGDNDGIPGGDYWHTYYTWGPDHAPYVISISPENGATEVTIDSVITVIFSEPLSSGTISNRTFLLHIGTYQVPGVVSKSEGYIEATFTPYEPLQYDTDYTVILTAEIEDVEGNPLDGNWDGIGGDNFYSYFSTGSDPDDFPPQVETNDPFDTIGTTNVPISTVITVTFNKEVTNVTEDTFMLKKGNVEFPTVFQLLSTTSARLYPISYLSYETEYKVICTDEIEDLGGRTLDGDYDGVSGTDYVLEFTTEIDPYSLPVYVYAIEPVPDDTGVSANLSQVRVTFSRPVLASSIDET